MRNATARLAATLTILTLVHSASAAPVNARATGLVAPIKQPQTMLCWLTSGTMMYNWKQQASHDLPEVADLAGKHYKEMYVGNKALPDGEVTDFVKAIGMKTEALACYTIEGFAAMLKANGPLWVWYNPNPMPANSMMHVVVAFAVVGDGTADGTKVTYADPDDGKVHIDTYKAFMEKYEGAAWDTTNFQIAHY